MQAPASDGSGQAQVPPHGALWRLLGAHVVAGAVAGMVTKTVVAPVERVKTVLQVQSMSGPHKGHAVYTGIWNTFRRLLAADGVRGLWKGNGANVARVIPVYGIKFGFNDLFKDMIAPGVAHPSAMQLTAVRATCCRRGESGTK